MKFIDKILKKLKTDKNTFLTYVLTLITIYLVVDRVIELLLMVFTGISSDYWGPIQYTLAFACPVFAFLFSGSSKFVKSDEIKLSFFYLYVVSLYILVISMLTQWINAGCWLALLSVPDYYIIATEFSNLIRPAFCWIALYIPLTTFYPVITWLLNKISDTKDIKDSIFDYKGINLSNSKSGTGPYSFEVAICTDKESGKVVKIPEAKRYDSMLVIGTSGSGKTSMIFEPMIARDIDKKYFLKENSKELAFVALKTGIAHLSCPYGNDYVNANFNLNMLKPNDSKIKIYESYMKKMILKVYDNQIVYRNLGITHISPDYESTSHILQVAKAYKMPVNLIDPNNPDSPGLNPFTYDNPLQTAVAISSVLKATMQSSTLNTEMAHRINFANQAIENLSILLKEMYPRMYDGDLPNLEDMLNMLNDFSLIEAMCEKLKEDPDLVKKYPMLLSYFKKHFYSDASSKNETERFVYSASTQIDNLLRYPGVKNILCNRTNNLNYDKVLENGEITLVCTRRGDLGASAHKAFGLFFILLMQYSVLRRPGNEDTRIPHFLYIDEFPDYICSATEAIFTMYRKYRVATVISAQNLAQLKVHNGKYANTITANCAHKIVFGNNSPEDNSWWELELGEKREWKWSKSYDMSKGSYDTKAGGIEYAFKPNYKAGKVQSLKFKNCMYKIRDTAGKNNVGTGKVDFLEPKYKEIKTVKKFNFEKFTSGIADETISKSNKKRKSVLTSFSDNDNSDVELDPVRTDSSDSSFLFDNENAILFDLNNKKKK